MREFWERLKERMSGGGGLRGWLNQNPVVATVAAVVLLLIAGLILITQTGGSAGSTESNRAYYYDVVAKEFFVDSAMKHPPFERPNGHRAVGANFYSCGQCTEARVQQGGERFLGYYTRWSEEVKKRFEEKPSAAEQFEGIFGGRMVCSPDKDPADPENWVAADSPEGRTIRSAPHDRCDGQSSAKFCAP